MPRVRLHIGHLPAIARTAEYVPNNGAIVRDDPLVAGGSVADSGDADLIDALLSAAGHAASPWSAVRVDVETSTNRSYIVNVEEGRFVARCYGWPYGGVDELRRPKKEAWLGRQLSTAGVPVAEVVATVEAHPNGAAALLRYVEGDLLGDLAAAGVPSLDQAWERAGAALRRAHDLDGPPGGAGVIVGDLLQPFEGGWSAWQAANLREHAVKLAARRGSAIPVHALHELAEAAAEVLAEAPLGLLHNDPHAWNVLVDRDLEGWRCAAWLDWEFAWVGDCAWDLARLDTFRMADIGLRPRRSTKAMDPVRRRRLTTSISSPSTSGW